MYTAIVTGANGQDGSYLTELLIDKGYKVLCLLRGQDIQELLSTCATQERIEIYNLAAIIHGGSAKETFEVNTSGILHILESVRTMGLVDKCRIFQASSSEIFGQANTYPQNEQTPVHPRSVYGISKVAADLFVKHYRTLYGMYVCSGILYNHESPRRRSEFITKKIIDVLGKDDGVLEIGNLESRRDWGHAKDYVRAMWLTLQQEKPEDYVIATGKSRSVRDFIEYTLDAREKNIFWRGQGLDEVGIIDGQVRIKISPEFFRPLDNYLLFGDTTKLKSIGWTQEYDIHGIIQEMLNAL